MSKYKLSIIIPHYNTPKLLDKMLSSIPKRDDVQVIVVDDNSEVGVQELLALKSKYDNIELYTSHYCTHSTGLCRNIGIEHSKGRWIMFGDADDYYTDGWFRKIEPYFDTDYDLVYFLPTSIDLETGECGTRHEMYVSKIQEYANSPCKKSEMLLRYDVASVCLKMHSSRLIKGECIRFEENLAEDTLFSVECGIKAKKVACLNEIIYCITQHHGSKTSNVSKELYDQRVKVKIRKCGMLYQVLPGEYLPYIGLENAGLQILYSAFADGMGFRKVYEYTKLLKRENVPIINWRYFNPVALVSKLVMSIRNRIARKVCRENADLDDYRKTHRK